MIKESSPSKKEKAWLFILVAAAVVALLVFMWIRLRSQGYNKAAIFYDGQQVALLDLKDYSENTILSISDFGVDAPVQFELSEHRIRFVNVECPDKVCEAYGYISEPTQIAVCMPNRVAVSIVEK